jgi:AcrR family transcriptional regulator
MSIALPRSARGRPPDPDLEARVLAATLDLYGEVGWGGFNFDLLARRARVGKAALYGKWGSKERLIVAALTAWSAAQPPYVESGSLRRDLTELAARILSTYLGHGGTVMLRAQLEAKVYPELFGGAMEELQRRRKRAGRSIVLGAIERGELPAGTSPALVLDAVAGIITNHVLTTPPDKMTALAERSAQYAETVADFVLTAAGYRAPAAPE